MTFRLNLVGLSAAALLATSSVALAQKTYDTGATDTEIKIGNIMPYSGPASAYGVIGKAEQAYFNKVNAEGGINGRKINFVSYDDAYSPPKAVEQVRKLVEGDEALVVFNPLGTPSNTAIQKVSQRQEGAAAVCRDRRDQMGRDPEELPVDDGLAAGTYQAEGRIYAKWLLQNKPDAKIAVIYQNDDYGKDYLKPASRMGFGAKARVDDCCRRKLRTHGADHRLPYRQAEVDRRGYLLHHRNAEVRRAIDQEDRRNSAGSSLHFLNKRLRLGRQRDQARRHGERPGHHFGGLWHGPDGPAVEGQ